MRFFRGKKGKLHTAQEQRNLKHLKALGCPLCGATVNQTEIQEHGYCQVCRLLVEALIGKRR